MKIYNVKAMGLHTIEGTSNKTGVFAVPFLWDGKDIAEAINNARFTLQVAGTKLPNTPIKLVHGKIGWTIRFDKISGLNNLGGYAKVVGPDVYLLLRQANLPSLFKSAPSITYTPNMVMLIGSVGTVYL